MLALHQNAERLRRADNLLPTREGGLATRPGAIQVIAGDVDQAKPWGDRILAEKAGRLVVWDGTETDVCAAGLVLQASAFQALTTSAAREDRLYVADGISNLWFLARRSGAYVREDVVNTILDATGAPYPLPIPSAIATWRNRLWLGSSSNRLTHCQNDRPAEWDPLYTVECQGKEPDRVRAIQPHGDVLVVGLGQALWGVTGDSQFNWQRAEIAGFGVTSADAIASDKVSLYWAADTGIYTLGGSEPLSDDIRELFSVAVGPAHVAIDRRRRLVLALVAGRLLAMHQDRPGMWGEIVGSSARGLLQLSQRIGWYGADGVWLLGARDTADKLLDGSERAFTSRYDTWEQRPNLGGRGRALLNRALFGVLGSSRANATYTVIAADDTQERTFSQSMSLADETVDTWSDSIETETALDWPTRPVRRELVPRLSGQSFRHIVTAPCFMEIKAFEPQYRFGQEDAA